MALIRRFRRIEGQARGLQKMVAEGREYPEILVQVASAREALHGAAVVLLEHCLTGRMAAQLEADSLDESRALVQRTLELFRKWGR